MTVENSKSILLSQLDTALYQCFMGQTDGEELSYPITKKQIVISPTGTGISLDPERCAALNVRKGTWYLTLRGYNTDIGGEINGKEKGNF